MSNLTSVQNSPSPSSWAGAERRAAPRHPLIRRCFVRLVQTRTAEGWRCIVYNLSATGIGLAFPLPLQPGTTVEIEGWRLPGGQPVRAVVVRTHPVEYVWFCGCEFESPLEAEQLQAWLMGPLR